MSDQPTEKHEPPQFAGLVCRGDFSLGTACGKCERCKWYEAKRVHQPSAVQAPEQATNAKTMAKDLVAKWLIDNSGFHVGLSDGNTEPDYNDLVVRIVDAYEAQAVRIRELEDALRDVGPRRQFDRPCYCVTADGLYCVSQPRCVAARAALKPTALRPRLGFMLSILDCLRRGNEC